jgi:arabinose-5-phosphate isomerase
MANQINIQQIATNAILNEGNAILNLQHYIDDSFLQVIQIIASAKGRIVLSGIGKSAIVAQKMVSTLNSTGTPALFMHAADAIHGDLGMIQQNDIVIIISKSGESPEIKVLLPLVKNFGNIVIGMVGNTASYLAKNSDHIINTTIAEEACPNNLAPTTSTTAQMVMGDVLAVTLMELNEFKSEHFAKYHPGGALGKQLYLTVADLYKDNAQPKVLITASFKEVVVEISNKRLGAAVVVNDQNEIQGIITDGDIRRAFEKYDDVKTITAAMIMGANVKTIASDAMAVNALHLMKTNNITQLVVANQNKYVGIIHLHEIIKEGII